MDYGEALSSKPRHKEKNVLHSINLRKADNGGIIAEHRMSYFDGKEPVHTFGKGEGPKLAEHLHEHLGISLAPQIKGNEADNADTEDAKA